MTFVLRMAAREMRAAWQRLLFFFICIAVGVAAIVALRSVIRSVRDVLGGEARSLIAADVLIATNRDWTPDALATIDKRLEEAGSTARTETIETPTMVRPSDTSRVAARMVELKAIQTAFPLYGTMTLEGAQPYSHALLENHGALVRPELLTALGVSVGESITIGEATFAIRGVVASEPGRNIGAFSLGPRVFIDFADAPSTGLLAFGSRVRHVLAARVPDERIPTLVKVLNDEFSNNFINTRSYLATDDAIGRDFDRAENYLSLVGLVIVILGGIAVSSVTRVFVLQKIRGIAVLKCLGATSAQIIAVYLLQVMSLGLAGSLLGIAIAQGAVSAIPLALGSSSSSLLAGARYGVTWGVALQGATIGVLVSLLFAIVPLLEVRLVRPSLLLRDEARPPSRDAVRMVAMVLVSGALVAVAAWQAASLRVGISVCLGFAVLAVVLILAGRLLVALLAPLANAPSFPLRHAVLHLSRPGNQTRVILLAVGLGAFFIVGVRSLQASLLAEFSIQVNADAADLFLLDVQRRQRDGMRAFLSDPANGPGTGNCCRCCGPASRGSAGERQTSNASRKSGPAGRSAASTPSRTATTSKPTNASWTERSGTAVRRSPRCRSNAASTSGSPSTLAMSCVSTSWAAWSTRVSPASGMWTSRIREPAVSCSCSGPERSNRPLRPTSRPSRGRSGRLPAPDSNTTSCRGFQTCQSSTFTRFWKPSGTSCRKSRWPSPSWACSCCSAAG
jgi:putative ABC transport system permease protein